MPPAERQFSLVLALVRTERGLTKADVLATVHGYRQLLEAGTAGDALDRMFDRDKEELRELGIDIETVDDPAAPGDNQHTRYLIREQPAARPEGIRLDPEEAALASIAAAVWREGTLAGESRRALFKLRARGVDVRDSLPAIAPRFRMWEGAFAPLSNAIANGERVEFDYRAAGASTPQRRRVEPLALVQFGGHWLLAAHDLDRAAERRFLLERISGPVRRTAPIDERRAETRQGRDIARETLDSLRSFAAANPVVIDVVPLSEAELRLQPRATERSESAPGTHVRLRLDTADIELLASELASYGPEVRIVSPPSLREAVRTRLERALAMHAAAEPDERGTPGEGSPG